MRKTVTYMYIMYNEENHHVHVHELHDFPLMTHVYPPLLLLDRKHNEVHSKTVTTVIQTFQILRNKT